MKKIISIILSIALTLAYMTVLASAAENVSSAPSISKHDFAEQCKEAVLKNQSRSIMSQEEMDELILLYSSGTDPVYHEKLLNDAGMFVYSTTINVSGAARTSDGGDVDLGKVSLIYNGVVDNWTLVCTAAWINVEAIRDDTGWFIPIPGVEHNIGGYDAVGIHLHDVTGTTPTLVESFAYVNYQNEDPVKYINPATYDRRYGISFTYQDKIKCLTSTLFNYTFKYFGTNLQVLTRYDSTFEDFSGTATMMYMHTGSGVELNGISVSNSGFSFNFSNSGNHFTIYSGTDLKF